jgi:Outer membrane protein beta-barrel domain
MERNFFNDDWEDLVRQKTDQYKMYPSDKVWKGIYNSLHTRRRRFIFGMSFLITGILFFAGKQLLVPARQSSVIKRIASSNIVEAKTSVGPNSLLAFPGLKKENHIKQAGSSLAVADDSRDMEQLMEMAQISDKILAPVKQEQINQIDNNQLINISALPLPSVTPVNTESALIFTSAPSGHLSNHTLEELPSGTKTDFKIDKLGTQSNSILLSVKSQPENSLVNYEAADRQQAGWLKDYGTQELKRIKRNKLNLQAYFSPTVNYRKLSVANNSSNTSNSADIITRVENVPIALKHLGNPNAFVDHSPAIGFELGSSLQYRLTRKLTFKLGLQFNYSRYLIKAYSSSPELATIALSPYYGYFTDSLTNYTDVHNFGGTNKENLENQYFQLSAPVGFEMRILGNGKLQINIAGTFQPTYLMNRNSYLLTTDYTNYTKEPSLFRKWNLNGGLEAFLSYQIGSLRWQIGPQFRYQLLSTYTNKYSLRENLMEYGIKIGISKTIR